MFNDYELTLHIDRLVGGIPKHPEIVKRWQEARWPKGETAIADLAAVGVTPETAAAETIESLGDNALSDEEVAAVWTSFAYLGSGDDARPAIESRQIKAMLKESANIIKGMPEVQVRGKAIPLRAKLAERVFPTPKWIPILSDRDGGDVTVQSLERPIHVMTAQGPRTALKRTDYVDDARLNVTLRVLDDGLIPEKFLRSILDHASLNGIGTDRSQGAGTFTYELERKGE